MQYNNIHHIRLIKKHPLQRIGWFLALMLLPCFAAAERVILSPAEEDYTITLESESRDVIRVNISINAFTLDTINYNGQSLAYVNLWKTTRTGELGSPDLPLIIESLIIPNSGQMSTRIIDYVLQDFDAATIVPATEPRSTCSESTPIDLVFGDAYSHNDYWPSSPVSLSEPFLLRDVRGVSFMYLPFQYNAVDHSLRVITEITFEVYVSGGGGLNCFTGTRPPTVVSEFNRMSSRHFLNYEARRTHVLDYPELETQGSMLIIYDDDFEDEMLPFKNWKAQAGIRCDMVSMSDVLFYGGSGDDTTRIKAYIANWYQFHFDLAYVLLVGDIDEIPSPFRGGMYTAGPSDVAYGQVSGDDAELRA